MADLWEYRWLLVIGTGRTIALGLVGLGLALLVGLLTAAALPSMRGFLEGVVPSIELASIGRRTAETEWELLQLIEGRAR